MSFSLVVVIDTIVGGILTMLWGVLLINRILGNYFFNLLNLMGYVMDFGILGFLIIFVIVYVIGWISQSVCDFIFKKIAKSLKRTREKIPFSKEEDFWKTRTIVLQHASTAIVNDIQLDRQVIRIFKQVCLHTLILSAVVWLYVFESWGLVLAVSIVCLMISTLSFFCWGIRLRELMKKFRDTHELIEKEKGCVE